MTTVTTWPLPMDFDSDGDMDLLVSCNDVPFNGLYFFENPAGPGETMPVFEPPVRIGPGKKNLQVSYVDGDARILERGNEYLDFTSNLFNRPEEMYPPMDLEEEEVFALADAKLGDADWAAVEERAPKYNDPVFGDPDPARFRTLFAHLTEELDFPGN